MNNCSFLFNIRRIGYPYNRKRFLLLYLFIIAVCLNITEEMAQTSISAFFAGRSVFITGATGFIGKALIEKLLRSCPDIATIFLLMRPKRGIEINDRVKEMLNNKVSTKRIVRIAFPLFLSRKMQSVLRVYSCCGRILVSLGLYHSMNAYAFAL